MTNAPILAGAFLVSAFGSRKGRVDDASLGMWVPVGGLLEFEVAGAGGVDEGEGLAVEVEEGAEA